MTANSVASTLPELLPSSSRLRRVVASMISASVRSSTVSARMCGTAAFCVSFTYWSRAPAALMASGSSSAPKPLRSSVPSWSVSRREALDSSKYQGGRVRSVVPLRPRSSSRALSEIEQLRGLEPLELGLQCLAALRFEHGEAPGGEIQPREAEALAVARDGGEQRVAPLVEQRLVRDRAGRDDANDRALDRPLGLRGVALLFADGDGDAPTHELREVRLGAVKRHARHRDRLPGGAAARRERDVQQCSSATSVLVEQLVKVAHAVEEQSVRVLSLDAQVLLHHRRVLRERGVVHGGRKCTGCDERVDRAAGRR